MKAQHTPGPWNYFHTPNDPDFTYEVTEDVCAIYGGKSADANARLIAAAPELLQALQELLEIHENPPLFAGKTGEERMLILEQQSAKVHAALSASRAAIAKATGGEV